MASRSAELRTAGLVAYVEGRRGLPLAQEVVTDGVLEALHVRVRNVEIRSGIPTPAPMQDATWDSLAWRVCRIDQQANGPVHTTAFRRSHFADLIHDPSDISMEALKNIIGGFKTFFEWQRQGPFPKCASDEEMLDVLRQRLCHAFGTRSVRLDSVPLEAHHVYAAAVDLSLFISRDHVPGGRMLGPGRPPPSARLQRAPAKKACCGCCDCSCHEAPDTSRDDGSEISEPEPSGLRKVFGFGWVRKLAFWRRKKVDDDGASTMSGSSITAAVRD